MGKPERVLIADPVLARWLTGSPVVEPMVALDYIVVIDMFGGVLRWPVVDGARRQR